MLVNVYTKIWFFIVPCVLCFSKIHHWEFLNYPIAKVASNFPKTSLLVSSVKIQYARDDEEPHFCINKNIDNDLYCSSNKFPNHLALLTIITCNSEQISKNLTKKLILACFSPKGHLNSNYYLL